MTTACGKYVRKLNIVFDMKRENAIVKSNLLANEERVDELKQRCFALYEKDYKVLHYDPMNIGWRLSTDTVALAVSGWLCAAFDAERRGGAEELGAGSRLA